MEKMSILQSSTHADCSCVVFCRSQANLLLKAVNPEFNAELYRAYCEDGNIYYLWANVDKISDETSFTPVFIGEDIPPLKRREPILPGEAFDHQDSYYVTNLNPAGDLVIRRITVISNEQMLRQLLSDDEAFADINEIYLAKLYVIGKGKQFLTLAWGIVCENLFTYLPIADKDWSLFDEYDIGALLRERAVPGIPIKMHGKYFTPLHDPKDGWCLACSKELRLVPRIG